MGYTLQEQYSSKNQVAGSAADSVWHKGARKVSSITIHWWGNKGQQFDTVRDFLCTNDTPTSAHYVAQDGLVACIVSPDDCAFHAGNAEGNSHSIGIECRPEATDGDYATVAELIAYLRGIYGDIPLHPHNHWYNTACPGDYDLARLDSLARGGTISAQSATITPTEEDDMFTDADRALLQATLTKADGGTLRADTQWQNGILADISARLGQTLDKADGGYIVGLLDAVKPGATDAGAIAEAVVSAVGKDVAAEVVKSLGEKLGSA